MRRVTLCTGLLVTLAAAPAGAAQNDPLQPVNHAVYDLNQNVLDRYIITPLVKFHNRAIPRPARISIRNFFENLGEPVNFENSLLQLHPGYAARSIGRFAINTTVGVVGLMDVAANWGMPPHKEDFGQTLGRYGVGEGPYLVMPVIGPAPTRDLAGRVVDGLMDPLSLVTFQGSTFANLGVDGATVLVERAHDVKEGLETSQTAKTYDSERDEYLAERVAEVANTDVQVAEAPNTAPAMASEQPALPIVLASYTPNADELSKVNAALKPTGLTVASIDAAPGEITYVMQPMPNQDFLPCSAIWDAVDVKHVIASGTIRFTMANHGGPAYICAKVITPEPATATVPLPVVATAAQPTS